MSTQNYYTYLTFDETNDKQTNKHTNCPGEKTTSSTNTTGKAGRPLSKEWRSTSIYYPEEK